MPSSIHQFDLKGQRCCDSQFSFPFHSCDLCGSRFLFGGTISMRPATTFDRGVSLIRHQNEDMNTSDPNAVEAALAVPASDGIVWETVDILRNSLSTNLLTYYAAYEATRAKIQALQAQLGAESGVDPGTGWSGLGFCGLLGKSIYFTYAFYVCRVVSMKSFRIVQPGTPTNHISGVLFIYIGSFWCYMKPWRVIYILNGLAFFTSCTFRNNHIGNWVVLDDWIIPNQQVVNAARTSCKPSGKAS